MQKMCAAVVCPQETNSGGTRHKLSMIALTTFDNREIAAGIWLLLIIVAIVMASSLRNPAKAVLVAITAKPIVVTASTVVVYGW